MDFPEKNGQGNPHQQSIADWLSNVQFRRQFIGGLDERSVWNKIRELNTLYEEALRAERIRYDTLLEEYRKRYGGEASSRPMPQPEDGSHDSRQRAGE